MTEILIVILMYGLGFVTGRLFEKMLLEKEEIKPEPEITEEKIPDPMELRNGLGVTKSDKPTFMEQIVNVMNYNGENQKEEAFDEETN